MAETTKVNKLSADFVGLLTNDDAFAPAKVPMSIAAAIVLASGTGADAVNKVYAKRRTLAATTAENLDLSGTLTNPLGTTLAFTKIRAIIIYLHAGTNEGPLLVGGHATAAFANWITSADSLNNDQPKIRIRNGASGGLFVLTGTDSTGLAVTATTADLLTIYNEGSASCDYDIIVLGE